MNKIIGHVALVSLLLVTYVSTLFSLDIVERTSPLMWNDTTRVAIIWNDGTGSEEFTGGSVTIGTIGESTKDFVLASLAPLNSKNIVEYHGKQPKWDTLTFNGIKKDFNGKKPHVITYINAGYEWAQDLYYPKPKEPYSIIQEAADSGVGIVAIGDDAAFDAKKIFPLTGPDAKGEPIQYDYHDELPDENYPYMGDGTQWTEIRDLWVWLDKTNDDQLPDGGLLWSIDSSNKSDTLWYNPFSATQFNSSYRLQADADIWDVNASQLDDYSFVGYQQGSWGYNKTFSGNTSKYIGNTPEYIAWPSNGDGYVAGNGYEYTVLAGLQQGNHRIVMICYQPQYFKNANASGQIVYNSIFWTSKAHARQKISTPKPDPLSGSVTSINSVTLAVLSPKKTSLYELHYTTDGSTPTKSSPIYTSAIEIPSKIKSDLTIKAIAFSKDTNWLDSDMLTVTYTYDANKISTPVADPDSGNTQQVTNVSILVALPTDKSLYKILYTFDASDSTVSNGTEYTGTISLPSNATEDVVLYAKAIPVNTTEWLESDVMKVVYTYMGGPLIDSAILYPGAIEDFSTMKRFPDTLAILFNTKISKITANDPFLSIDTISNSYNFLIDPGSAEYKELAGRFIVTDIFGKPLNYLPISMKDSIKINPSANVKSESKIVQDGSNNRFVPLKVLDIPSDINIESGWIKIPDFLENTVNIDKGLLTQIDFKTILTNKVLSDINISVKIYDQVGNLVLSEDNLLSGNNPHISAEIVTLNNRPQIFTIWDGKNSKNRNVGSGSYLAQITYPDENGNTTVNKEMWTISR